MSKRGKQKREEKNRIFRERTRPPKVGKSQIKF
jgi:hypothetical protein